MTYRVEIIPGQPPLEVPLEVEAQGADAIAEYIAKQKPLMLAKKTPKPAAPAADQE